MTLNLCNRRQEQERRQCFCGVFFFFPVQLLIIKNLVQLQTLHVLSWLEPSSCFLPATDSGLLSKQIAINRLLVMVGLGTCPHSLSLPGLYVTVVGVLGGERKGWDGCYLPPWVEFLFLPGSQGACLLTFTMDAQWGNRWVFDGLYTWRIKQTWQGFISCKL